MKKLMFLSTLSLLLLIGKSNAQSWGLLGNSIVSGDFLGSTNGVPLEFEVDGNQAGWLDYTSPYNTTFGYEALFGTNGTMNTAIGYEALTSNTQGNSNTAVGYEALFSNTMGLFNVAMGYSALYTNSTGNYNTATGANALYTNSSGSYNTATGYNALYSNSGGNNNTAEGYGALYTNLTGNYNTATGDSALFLNLNGSSNTALGRSAGYNSTGSWNTFLGDSAGWDNAANDSNVFIGYQAGGTSGWTAAGNSVWIGYQTQPTPVSSNNIYLGNGNTTAIQSSSVGSLSTWSDRRIKDNIKENVPGLAFINMLIPVTFNYDVHKENQVLGGKDNPNHTGKYAVEKITQSGFIAQQVDSAAQACGYDFNGVTRPQSPNGLYALGYSDFVVPLVKAVQELSARHDSLRSTVDSLRREFRSFQTCLNQICSATGNNSNGGVDLTTGEQNITLSSANSPLLYQNIPNPFSTGTKINYFLPEGTIGATIVFYDAYGNPIKTVQLNQTGNSTLNITADNLSSGIYSYSLIVNGNLIDTKRMILQK